MPIIQFPAYRWHEQARTDANNAIMALLAGAHLAANTLQLVDGTTQLLPAIFPKVPHIGRFNLEATRARELLDDAELHLGAMAVPYVLALHEDFVRVCLTLFGAPSNNLKASTMHARLAAAMPISYGPHLGAFHSARILRNSFIHNGAIWDQRTESEALRDVDPAGDAEWRSHTNRSVRRIALGTRVTIAHGELVGTLSATHNIAKLINVALQTALPRQTWADIVVDDIVDTQPQLLRNSRRDAKCTSYARHLYGPIQLTTAEIVQALTSAGY